MNPILPLVYAAFSSSLVTDGLTDKKANHQDTVSRADPATSLKMVKITSQIIKRDPSSGTKSSMENDLINDFQMAQDLVSQFYETLQSFVVKGHFNFTAFSKQENQLELRLKVVGGVAQKFRAVSEPFSQQFGFVKNAFHQMADSSIDLYLYNISTAVGHRWLYKITDLNIRLLTLHGSSGQLDLSNREVFTQLFCCWRNLHVWEGRFSNMDNVPDVLREAFGVESKKAEKTIRVLAKQLPGDISGC